MMSSSVVSTPEFKEWVVKGRGKGGDVYDFGGRLLIVATDRISAFDVIIPNPIPAQSHGMITRRRKFYYC